MNNVIGMNGTKLPREIAILGKEKEITLFIDGDRGGRLIANNVISNANIAYVATAPDGKEVEELAGKEILIALRRKIRAGEYLKRSGNSVYNGNGNSTETKEIESKEVETEFKGDLKEAVKNKFASIKGTKSAVLVDGNFDIIRRVSAREVARSVGHSRNKIFAVVIDGSATKSIIESCEEQGVKHLAATNFSDSSDKLNLISL